MPTEMSCGVRAGDLVRIVSLAQNRYRVRRSTWLLGHLARVLFVPAQGVWAEVELLAQDLPYGRGREWQLHVGGLQVVHAEDIDQVLPARPPRVGDRVTVVRLFHSHARTQAHEDVLLSRRGVIVIVWMLRSEYALVELDEPPPTLPDVRRWSFHIDDLHIQRVRPCRKGGAPAPGVGLGADGARHAITPANPKVASCGAAVRPVVIDGWSPPFSPALERACPDCADKYCSPDTFAGSR